VPILNVHQGRAASRLPVLNGPPWCPAEAYRRGGRSPARARAPRPGRPRNHARGPCALRQAMSGLQGPRPDAVRGLPPRRRDSASRSAAAAADGPAPSGHLMIRTPIPPLPRHDHRQRPAAGFLAPGEPSRQTPGPSLARCNAINSGMCAKKTEVPPLHAPLFPGLDACGAGKMLLLHGIAAGPSGIVQARLCD